MSLKATNRRLKRKVRLLQAQKQGLLRELFAMQARENQSPARGRADSGQG